MRRGAVVVIVIWAIAIAASIVAAVQLVCFRQATIGRETLARVQARWAARAGIEEAIAIMAWHGENPDAGGSATCGTASSVSVPSTSIPS
ncbi:MAG: hypothetical protein ACYTE2_02935 [Planctomycetota bacterium]|jgi:type II secretory pathway component PulK